MIRRVFGGMVILLLMVGSVGWGENTTRRQSLEAVALVSDRFEAADALERWLDERGGYLISRLEEELILRVPSEMLEAFVDHLETVADEVIQIQLETFDIGQDILEAQAGIRSKSELFERALALIDQTDLTTTLEIEREVLSILQDVERLEGRYRMLLSEVELARVVVSFTMEEEKLPQNLPSAFPWINMVDFYILMDEFGQN